MNKSELTNQQEYWLNAEEDSGSVMINRVFSTFSNYSTYRQRNSVEGLSRSPNRNFDVLKNINNYDSTHVYWSGISSNFDKNNELWKDRSSSIYFSTRTLETKSANLRNTSDNLNYNFRRPYPGISEFESRNRNVGTLI